MKTTFFFACVSPTGASALASAAIARPAASSAAAAAMTTVNVRRGNRNMVWLLGLNSRPAEQDGAISGPDYNGKSLTGRHQRVHGAGKGVVRQRSVPWRVQPEESIKAK